MMGVVSGEGSFACPGCLGCGCGDIDSRSWSERSSSGTCGRQELNGQFSNFAAKNVGQNPGAHRWEGDAAAVLAGHGRGAGEAGGAAVVEALRGARDVAVL